MIRRTRWLIAAVPLAFVAILLLRPGMWADHQYFTPYNGATVSSAIALAFGVWRWRPRPLWPWVAMAAGLGVWSLGDIVYIAIGTTPTISVADLFYLLGYIGLIAGVLGLLRARVSQANADSVIEILMLLTASVYAVWQLVISPTWSASAATSAGRLLVAIYPILDAVLLVLILELVLGRGRRPTALVLLALGMLAVFSGDVVYAVIQQTDSFGSSTLLNASWPGGYVLLALAGLHPTVRDVATRAAGKAGMHPARLFSAGLALISLPVVDLVSEHIGGEPAPAPLFLTCGFIVGLVLLRVFRLHREAERAAASTVRSESHYRALATNSISAYVIMRPDGVVTETSPAYAVVRGRANSVTVGANALVLVPDSAHPDDLARLQEFLGRAVALPNGSSLGIEVRLGHDDGTFSWFELRATSLVADEAVAGVIVTLNDIDARKRAEVELEHQAFHDGLTGLANRLLLRDRIEHALARAARTNDSVALLFCDLDGFKGVNDTLGHDAGDELLCVAATRLHAIARAGDTVARLGGDELAVLLEGDGVDPGWARATAVRLREALSGPVMIAGTPMVVTASIGIALCSAAPGERRRISAEELVREADVAMYNAKTNGRNRESLYESGMSVGTVNQPSLVRDILSGIERNEFFLQYQPIVNLDTERLVGFEALVRWQHPERGVVPPGEFIPAAEDTMVIVDLGRWVLREACAAAAQWPASEGQPLTVAVNVSARQFETDAIVADVLEALARSGLAPGRLVVELTESTLVSNPDAVSFRLAQLKKLGVKVAIDDFGTGYSSLSYLRRFPVDVLKVDRSFIETIHDATRVPAIVRGLLDLARTLGLETVAEGIERDEQRIALVHEGCTKGQGFLFARPLDAAMAMALALEHACPPRLLATSPAP